MNIKNATRLLGTMLLMFVVTSLALGDPPPYSAFAKFKSVYETYSTSDYDASDIVGINYDIALEEFLSSGDYHYYDDSLLAMAQVGLDSSCSESNRRAAYGLLRLIDSSKTRQIIYGLMDDPFLGHRASLQVLRWGDWDAAAPRLMSLGVIVPLARDPRMIPFLQKRVNSSDPIERFVVSHLLAKYHTGSSLLLPSGRQVLQLYKSKMEHAGTRELALKVIVDEGLDEDLPLLTSVVCSDSNEWIRAQAIGAIFNSAKSGNPIALSQLQIIQDSCSFADMRDRAKMELENMNK